MADQNASTIFRIFYGNNEWLEFCALENGALDIEITTISGQCINLCIPKEDWYKLLEWLTEKRKEI